MRFLNYDNPIGRKMIVIADLLIANICFILSSFFIITIATSYMSLLHTVDKIKKDETTSVIKTFFTFFLKNLSMGIKLFLFFSGSITIILFSINGLKFIDAEYQIIFLPGLLFGISIWLCSLIFLYSYTAKFKDNFFSSLKVSMFIGFSNSFVMLKLILLLICYFFLLGIISMKISLFFLGTIGVSLFAYAHVSQTNKIFKKYEK